MYTFNEEMHLCCQLIRYLRACGSYHDLLDKRLLLTRKLLHQGFLVVQLQSSLLRVCSVCGNHIPVFFTFMTYHRVVTRVTRQVPHMELLTCPDHLTGLPLLHVLVGFVLSIWLKYMSSRIWFSVVMCAIMFAVTRYSLYSHLFGGAVLVIW